MSHVTVTGMLVCSTVGSAVRAANLSPPLSGLSSHLSPYLPTAAPCPSHIALVSWPSQSYLNSHRDSLILQRTHNWPLCPHYGHGWPFVKVYFLAYIYWPVAGPWSSLRWPPVQELLTPGAPEPGVAPVVRLQARVLLVCAVITRAVSQRLKWDKGREDFCEMSSCPTRHLTCTSWEYNMIIM